MRSLKYGFSFFFAIKLIGGILSKLFVSLPMRGRELDDIRMDMQAICQIVSAEMNEQFELIDTVWLDEPSDYILADPGACSSWYLGKSIQAIAEADLVVFDENWRFARGCIIEHMVCALYNIPYVDMSVSYNDDTEPVNDYAYDINELARIENILSEKYEEDALGFEHDGIFDLEGEAEEIEEVENNENDLDALEPGEYDADAQ